MSKEKGSVPFPILVIIFMTIILSGFYYLRTLHSKSNTSALPTINTNKYANNLPDDLKNAPIYPQATFVSKTDGVTTFYCPENHYCVVSNYNFETTDSLERILGWYQAQSDWKFNEVNNLTKSPSVQIINASVEKDNKKMIFDLTSSGLNSFSSRDALGLTYYIAGPDYSWPTATPKELTEWQNYDGLKDVLTIKYPSDWKNENGTIYLTADCDVCGGVRSYFYVTTSKNENNLTSEQYVKNTEEWQKLGGNNGPEKIIINKPDIFKNIDASVVVNIPGSGSPGPNIYIAKGKQMITIESDGIPLETLSKILSTIKFLN